MTHGVFFSAADLRVRGSNMNESECVTQCRNLSRNQRYGLVTPIFEEQFVGIRNPLNFTKHHRIWLGLRANDSFLWNRYNPKQTVRSLPILQQAHTPNKFKKEYPVFYHNNNPVINPRVDEAVCVCEKGENSM